MMEKNKKLVIVGAGELAMIAYEYFTYDSSYEVCGFAVEREFIDSETLYDLPIVAFEEVELRFPPSEFEAFVAIPASQLNRLRTRLYQGAKQKNYTCATYISSRAFVWRNAQIGENCFIFEDNTVQPFVEIGDNVILWSGNHIGHRSVIEDNCFVSSHVVVSGYCRIGESCFLGVNSTLNDHVVVARDCIVASGSLVSKSLKEPERIYYGSPAKELPKKSSLSVKL
jgi:sugar O-acyltransferase (sialic acid O-acetyltransferase NeuD family)